MITFAHLSIKDLRRLIKHGRLYKYNSPPIFSMKQTIALGIKIEPIGVTGQYNVSYKL